jgi:hypothetical protein
LGLAACGGAVVAADGRALEFAVEMAESGNWREAKYRWEKAALDDPDNARLQNNLAVAAEALGDGARAGQLYARAHGLDPKDLWITDNEERSRRFWQSVDPARGAQTDAATLRGEAPSTGKKLPKTAARVQVELPVPPRIQLGERRTLLVASFLTPDNQVVDGDREIVRFLRSEYRRRVPLEVLDITPAPAIPEQTLEELARNAEFWKYLGRRFDADVVVSGQVSYDLREVSGFRDVDIVSETTGHKVRTTRFVEEEEFTFAINLLFLDGRTGELLHRDNVRRSIRFPGLGNDPITAFFELSGVIAEDLLSALVPRRRTDYRIVFRG